MTEREKMLNGMIYDPGDSSITGDQVQYQELLYDYNQTRPHESEKRFALLQKMFADIGEGCYIEPPLHANMGGHHVRFGKWVYANYGLTLVDDTYITVGDGVMFGPHVMVATAGHPILPRLRARGMQFNIPVTIGRNCWIGAGAVILPGVTIGENTVVGAGSIVTKDLPANVIAVGNPCRVVRPMDERDIETYWHGRAIDWVTMGVEKPNEVTEL